MMQKLLERNRGNTGALVLTPTRELANQIKQVFRSLANGTLAIRIGRWRGSASRSRACDTLWH
jgi:superfamily II DNA/RNA helicase